ncbi:hypothetical protein [Catellatospora sp. NPDC049609]|uniref:hypothetical protein n=1 Tax=Catellatospora sp. NPDC049609 TaxID=3155505 RepID=UPI003447DFE6
MILLLKLVLAPGLVVASSLAGRRWGAQVTGTLVALPIVAGPILLITCLQHGAAFGARAAGAALLGLVTLALFTVVFARCSRTTGWAGSLAAAWAACLAGDFALAGLALPPVLGLGVVLAAVVAALRMLPAVPPAGPADGAPAWPWWDLPGRAAATAALVVAVTAASGALGPGLTGVLAPFPIATSVVAAFVLAQSGSDQAVRTLRGVAHGLVGFAVFCFGVAVLVEPAGTAGAFGVALAATLGVQLGLRAGLSRWRMRTT